MVEGTRGDPAGGERRKKDGASLVLGGAVQVSAMDGCRSAEERK